MCCAEGSLRSLFGWEQPEHPGARSHGGSSQSCTAPVRTVGTCSTQGIKGGLGGRKGGTSCPAMPQCAQSILCQAGTSECQLGPLKPFLGHVSLSVPCWGGCLGTLWFSQALAKGVCGAATPGVGQQSNRNGDFTEVAPKSLYSSRAGHEAAFATKAAAGSTPGLARWHQDQLLPVPLQSPNHLLPPKCELVTSQDVWAVLLSLPCSGGTGSAVSVRWIWLRLGAVVGAVKSWWWCHAPVLRLPNSLFPAGSRIFAPLGGFLGDECLL